MKLPKGWVAVLDEESKDYFYWNQTSDATQWEIPTESGAGDVEVADAAEEVEAGGADYAAAGKRKNRQVIMAESYDPSAGGKAKIVSVEKPESAKACIRAALQSGNAALLFSSLTAAELETVVMAMTEKVVVEGDVVIKQGDQGDYFFVAESGSYSIYVNGNKVASRGAGDRFGELALLYNCGRAAAAHAARARDRLTPTEPGRAASVCAHTLSLARAPLSLPPPVLLLRACNPSPLAAAATSICSRR